MTQIPENLKYTAAHEWMTTDNPATVGITAVAADALGDIVFLELPKVGAVLTAGAVCGEVESTKSVSEVYSPVNGKVMEVNHAAVSDPSLVNSDPFGQGWLIRVDVTSVGDVLTPEGYAAILVK